jgi:hypothetical protein
MNVRISNIIGGIPLNHEKRFSPGNHKRHQYREHKFTIPCLGDSNFVNYPNQRSWQPLRATSRPSRIHQPRQLLSRWFGSRSVITISLRFLRSSSSLMDLVRNAHTSSKNCDHKAWGRCLQWPVNRRLSCLVEWVYYTVGVRTWELMIQVTSCKNRRVVIIQHNIALRT